MQFALKDMLAWLRLEESQVGVYDATNSTRDRRAVVRRECEAAGHRVVFIESICNDPEIIDTNVRQTKLFSPDYVGIPADEAVHDFRLRIAHYEHAYEPVGDDEGASSRRSTWARPSSRIGSRGIYPRG